MAKLVITDPYIDDTGVYTCVAKSIAGEARTSCRVTVKGRRRRREEDGREGKGETGMQFGRAEGG